MPGPPPKRPDRRQRTNTPSLNLVVTADQAPATISRPEPSHEWLTVTRNDWQALWADPLVDAYNRPSDLPGLRRLFGMRDDRERCRRALRTDPLVEGSMGQPVLNPLASLIGPLDSEIRQLEDRFGLNPKARLGLGVTLGKAKKSLDDLAGGLSHDEPEEADPREAAIVAQARRKT